MTSHPAGQPADVSNLRFEMRMARFDLHQILLILTNSQDRAM